MAFPVARSDTFEGPMTAGNGFALPSHAHSGGYVSGNNSSADHTHSYSPQAQGSSVFPDRWSEETLRNMLGSRLRWNSGVKCPFQKVVPYRVTDKIVVFIATKDDAVIIEDDPNLYPSDALVTQMRLLAATL